MPTSKPLRLPRNLGVLAGIPLFALILGTVDGDARSQERSIACRAAQEPAVRTQPDVRGHAGVRRLGVRARKRSGDSRTPPRSTPAEQRRGGVGTLIGITFA